VDPVPDPLLLRKSGSTENRTRDLRICSQELRSLDHRGGGINKKYIYYSIYHRAGPQRTIPQIASTQRYCMAQWAAGKIELDQFKIKRIFWDVLYETDVPLGRKNERGIIYINKNVNVRLLKILNLSKFFTDCFEILTQRCIRLRAFLCTYII
jgi:hypothetical protein